MKADTRKNERRQSIRIDTHKMVSNCRIFSAETQGRFQFTVWPTKNISTHGIAINSDENISRGALAFLNIDLDILKKTVGVIAKVIWCKERKQGYEAGLNFNWWPKEDDRELMLNFMKSKIAAEEIL